MVDLYETNDPKSRELITLIDAGENPDQVLLIRDAEMQNLNTEEYLRNKKNAIRLISTGIFDTY